MENTKKYVSELHQEHVDWIDQLNSCKEEISTFKHRLEEIVMANTNTEVLANVEHFQNQFIRHNEVIDELKHEINGEENLMIKKTQTDNVATDHRKADENMELVDQMKSFDKIYTDLKKEFQDFVSNI